MGSMNILLPFFPYLKVDFDISYTSYHKANIATISASLASLLRIADPQASVVASMLSGFTVTPR